MNLENLQQTLMNQWLKMKNGVQGMQQDSQNWQQNAGALHPMVQSPWQLPSMQSLQSFIPTKDTQNRNNSFMDALTKYFNNASPSTNR